jgi:hypothetical protein
MAWARWAVAALAAVLGAVLVLSAPIDQLERAVWTLGLRNVIPQMAPPLGETARMGLAALAAALAALLGWGLLALLGVGSRPAETEARADLPKRDSQPAIPAWRRPPEGLPPAGPVGLAASVAAGSAATATTPGASTSVPQVPAAAEQELPVRVPAPVIATEPSLAEGSVAGPAPMAMVHASAPPPAPAAEPVEVPMPPAPEPPASPAQVPAGAAPQAAPHAMPAVPAIPAMDEAARTAMLASLARIEATLAEARQGPVVGPNAQLIARFEELDSRITAQVSQIAQQLVEVALLARSAARAPAPAAPAPAAPAAPAGSPLDALRPLAPRQPRRPASRAELAAAIRGLRAQLDSGPGLGGQA